MDELAQLSALVDTIDKVEKADHTNKETSKVKHFLPSLHLTFTYKPEFCAIDISPISQNTQLLVFSFTKQMTFWNHVGWIGCSTADDFQANAVMNFYTYCGLPKDARLNWFNTHMQPQLAKESQELHSVLDNRTLAEVFTSRKYSPDCTGSGKLNWGLSPLGFATRDASQTLKHQRQCKDFRQASHNTIRDIAKLRADNPLVLDSFDKLANLVEDTELFCKKTWGKNAYSTRC